MATYQSVRSGDWSSSSTWSPSGVPGDGDTVIINSGHEVLFDVDQSSFPNGLASVTINGTLRFPTASGVSTALKVTGDISGSGALWVGNSVEDHVPRDALCKIILAGQSNAITVSTQRYYGWTPARHYTTLSSPSNSGSYTVTLSEPLDLIAGDQICIGAGSVNGRLTETSGGIYTVQSVSQDGRTVTLSSALGHSRLSGDLVGHISRSIIIERTVTPTDTGIRGNYHVISGVQLKDVSVSGIGIYCYKCSAVGYHLGAYCTAENIEDCVVCRSQYAPIFTCSGKVSGLVVVNCVSVSLYAIIHTFHNCRVQNTSTGINGYDLDVRGCRFSNLLNRAIDSMYGGLVRGCTFTSIANEPPIGYSSYLHVESCVYDGSQYFSSTWRGPARIVDCSSASGEYIGWTSWSENWLYFELEGCYGLPDYVAYSPGGKVESVSNFSPPGYSRSIRATCLSSSRSTRYDRLLKVAAGARLRATLWVYKNNTQVVPVVQLVTRVEDPIRHQAAQPLFSRAVTTDGQWVAVPIEWRNEYGYDVEVIIRVMATAGSGNFWCLVDLQDVGKHIEI